GVEQSPDSHPEGDVFTHTIATLGHLTHPTETLAYGCLLHDVAKPGCYQKEGGCITFHGHTEKGAEMAVEILRRLKRSRTVWESVAYLVRNHLRYMQAPKMRLSTLKRFLREDGIEELMELCRIDALSSSGDLQYYNFCKQKMTELKKEEIRPEPLLRGRDLMVMGFSPGPVFQDILREVEEAQLDGQIFTKEQALEWVINRYGNPRDRRS
ncbi:MAG: HD domain-containing protein, partial [Candidatus Binatia bacterium]